MVLDRKERKRGIWLTAGLVYIALSNAWGTFRSLDVYWDLVSHRAPNVPHWPFLTLGILSSIAIIGVVGLWLWKRWGLLVYLACWASALGVNIFLGVPFWTYVLSLANVALLYVFLQPKWDLLQ
jgi:hypothetical protein